MLDVRNGVVLAFIRSARVVFGPPGRSPSRVLRTTTPLGRSRQRTRVRLLSFSRGPVRQNDAADRVFQT